MSSETKKQWNRGWEISADKREWFREKSIDSAQRKKQALSKTKSFSNEKIRKPKQDNSALMPTLSANGIDSVSLFSGCGGLDLGFERCGYRHLLSVDILDICGDTIQTNRPNWFVKSGQINGNVQNIAWKNLDLNRKNDFLIVHGGPPCQPFSTSGRQLGKSDERDMVPEFFRCVTDLKPDAFCMENVPALGNKKFSPYLDQFLKIKPKYYVRIFKMFAPLFGVPQRRERLFIVGFRDKNVFSRFKVPVPTHNISNFVNMSKTLKKYVKFYKGMDQSSLPHTYGMREAIGLNLSYEDNLSPTFRSGFTGPRNSTSILNGASSQKVFKNMGIWGNGIAPTISDALNFPTPDGTVRLATQDCAVVQGFPQDWQFKGAVYQVIGQIGNSVAPPVAYQVARSIKLALHQ